MPRSTIEYICTQEELAIFRSQLKSLCSPNGMFPFLREMGGQLDWVQGRQAQGTIHVKAGNQNPFGMLHGGALYTLADTIGAYPALQPGIICLTKCGGLHFFNPARNGRVMCTATVQRLTSHAASVLVEIIDPSDTIIASGFFEYTLVPAETS